MKSLEGDVSRSKRFDGATSRPGFPPGPRWPMPAQTLLAVFATERYTDWCLRRFGSVVTLRVFGLGRFVSVADPGLIKELFTGDREVLRGGEANALLGTLARSSVVVADGDEHLRLRRVLLPPFHGEAVRRYRDLVVEIASDEVRHWPVGAEFAVLPRMRAITLEVILRAVLGVRDHRRMERLRCALPDVLATSLVALFAENAYPGVFASRLGRRLAWLRAREEVNRLLDEEIAARRADPGQHGDILTVLMSAGDQEGRPLSGEELRDQLMTLLIAGHETTASALAWCFERLLRHPHALARLRQELADGEDDAYLDAVIHETLRVRPVVDQVVRKLSGPFELAGYALPAGAIVAASILGMQRSDAFADSQQFRPERFLDEPAAPYTLIPFGGGPRRCIGSSFAVMEMKAILRTVLETVELQAPSPKSERPTRWRRFTTSPARGGRVIVTGKLEQPEARSRVRPSRFRSVAEPQLPHATRPSVNEECVL